MILPDLLAPNLDIIFCGTAVGAESARRRAYYAGPGNAFWPTLLRVGLTDRRLPPEDYTPLAQFGVYQVYEYKLWRPEPFVITQGTVQPGTRASTR